MQNLTNSQTQPAPMPTAADALEFSPEARAKIGALLSAMRLPAAPMPTADTTDLKRELRELDSRAADLSAQATAADKTAADAQAALTTGTGSARDAADARNTQAALKDALATVSARRAAVVSRLEQIAADAAAHQIEMQAVGAAQRAGAYRRDIEAAAIDAAAALQRFADIARPKLDAHEREQSAFTAQARALTQGSELEDVHYHLELGETLKRLRALGADETQAPDLSALPFGELLAQVLKGKTAPAVYLNLPPVAPTATAQAPADANTLPPGFVSWPSR